jgi:hypothetical protein
MENNIFDGFLFAIQKLDECRRELEHAQQQIKRPEVRVPTSLIKRTVS